MISYILMVLAALAVAAFFYFKNLPMPSPVETQAAKVVEAKPARKQSVHYGMLNIFFGSQTGTAAKMADGFAAEAKEEGFEPKVIDLKYCKQQDFSGEGMCIFFMSNTGEGEAPDNTVEFMKILRKKSETEIDFRATRFAVFGLGNTQYQFYNKVGKDVDELLEKRGAKRIHPIGLGDNNSSLEDDYNDWKAALWPVLKEQSHQKTTSVVVEAPAEMVAQKQARVDNIAPWKFVKCSPQITKEHSLEDPFHRRYELEFLTKNYVMHSEPATIKNICQVRQNTKDGSTLHVQIAPTRGSTYKTAGNVAIYPENDPELVKKVAEYFNLDMDSIFEIEPLNADQKIKLNFVTPIKMSTLLKNYIDLQHPITKSLLKHLAKFDSTNPTYFKDNCSVKTTPEYTRLSSSFTYLFKLVEEYKVQLTFESFIHLSDPVGPRVFTIASSSKVTKSIEIADSIEENGLCSKFFDRRSKDVRIEIRDSSFSDVMSFEKVVFIGAGTGFAPFRAFLQEKEHLLRQNAEAKLPLVSLFFGCRYQDGDFIYRESIKGWAENKVIDKFYPAFSRDTDKKVYVQDLLAQNPEEVRQTLAQGSKGAIYICGSTQMGAAVIAEIVNVFVADGLPKEAAVQRATLLEKEHRIVKELW